MSLGWSFCACRRITLAKIISIEIQLNNLSFLFLIHSQCYLLSNVSQMCTKQALLFCVTYRQKCLVWRFVSEALYLSR